MEAITREELNKLHNEKGMSWRKIAALDKYKNIPTGSLCSYAGGWEPKTDRARRMFGLPTIEMIPQVRDGLGQFSKRSR